MARVVPALLVAVLAVGPVATAEAAPLRVLVTGDSLVRPLDDLMVRPVERAGGRVARDPRPGTGLTRPLVLDWPKHARRQTRKHHPRVTVMFIGAGDSEPLPSSTGPEVACCRRAWIDAYADRVERMMRSYMRRKRSHVYWLTLPAPRQQGRRQQFLAINYAITQAARKAGEKAHVVDTVPVLSPDNRFRRERRYRGRNVVVRDGDGVHLTTPGARIVRDLVMRAIRGDGLFPRAAPSATRAGTVTLVYEPPLPALEIGAAYALSVEAGRGAANQIAVAEGNDAYTVTDAGAPLDPGPGCVTVSPAEVRCPTARAVTDRSAFVDAGSAADRVALTGLASRTAAEVRGGAGQDVIFGRQGADLLLGGGGDDALAGGPGVDRLDGGPGDDTLHGGSDRDWVSYQWRSRPVTVDLARQAGGSAGEHDLLLELEGVIGGAGADELRGSGESDTLVGGEGRARDRVRGRAGDDGLIGHRVAGGPGDDVVDARRLSCGRGEDLVHPRTFPAPGSLPLECERIVAVFVVVRPHPIGTRRAPIFGVRCHTARRCRGALALHDSQGFLGRARFSFRRPRDLGALQAVRILLERPSRDRVVSLRLSGQRAYQRFSLEIRLP